MNELIKIEMRRIGDIETQTVLFDDLYMFLGLSEKNKDRWRKENIENNKFAVNGDDFVVFLQQEEYNKIYILSLAFAKKLSMMSKSKKGEEARNYFLECERIAKQQIKQITPTEALLLAVQQIVELERHQNILEEEQRRLAERQRITETRLEDFATGAEHFSITAYHKLFRNGYEISHSQANKDGQSLSKIAKNQGIQLGKAPHPMWGTINTYPKSVLDAFYRGEFH